MKRPILIAIDMLNDLLDKWEPGRRRQLVEATNDLALTMRRLSHPVIWVRQEFEPDLHDAFSEMKAKGIQTTIRGTRGSQIVDELKPAPSDIVVVKKRYSAFFGTGLDETLATLEADAMILAGINTHACVRMTAIDAYQRDFRVILASECIDSYDREHHDVSMRYMKDKIAEILSNREIDSMLLATQGAAKL